MIWLCWFESLITPWNTLINTTRATALSVTWHHAACQSLFWKNVRILDVPVAHSRDSCFEFCIAQALGSGNSYPTRKDKVRPVHPEHTTFTIFRSIWKLGMLTVDMLHRYWTFIIESTRALSSLVFPKTWPGISLAELFKLLMGVRENLSGMEQRRSK